MGLMIAALLAGLGLLWLLTVVVAIGLIRPPRWMSPWRDAGLEARVDSAPMDYG